MLRRFANASSLRVISVGDLIFHLYTCAFYKLLFIEFNKEIILRYHYRVFNGLFGGEKYV